VVCGLAVGVGGLLVCGLKSQIGRGSRSPRSRSSGANKQQTKNVLCLCLCLAAALPLAACHLCGRQSSSVGTPVRTSVFGLQSFYTSHFTRPGLLSAERRFYQLVLEVYQRAKSRGLSTRAAEVRSRDLAQTDPPNGLPLPRFHASTEHCGYRELLLEVVARCYLPST
jgi:hypothetical protein